MSTFGEFDGAALDRHITGNYGQDFERDFPDELTDDRIAALEDEVERRRYDDPEDYLFDRANDR